MHVLVTKDVGVSSFPYFFLAKQHTEFTLSLQLTQRVTQNSDTVKPTIPETTSQKKEVVKLMFSNLILSSHLNNMNIGRKLVFLKNK